MDVTVLTAERMGGGGKDAAKLTHRGSADCRFGLMVEQRWVHSQTGRLANCEGTQSIWTLGEVAETRKRQESGVQSAQNSDVFASKLRGMMIYVIPTRVNS